MLIALLHAVLVLASLAISYLAFGEITVRLPQSDPLVGYGAVGLLFLLLAVAHFAIAQIVLNINLRREIEYIAYEHQEMAKAVAGARREIEELSTLASDGDVARSNSEMVSEMRILRSLITQLNVRRGQGRANRTGTAKNDDLTDTTSPLATPLPINLSATEVLDITRAALEKNRVDLYIQPIVNLPQRQVRFYEAFSRVRHEDGGIILPEQYIPVAREAGLISTIDNLLLFRCVQLIRRVHRDQSNLGFFCNISRDSLTDHEFFPQFVDFLEHNIELAGVLIFEFEQDDLALPQVDTNLERLAHLGFTF
ncbi:MAG: EAL domain-containing protein, partial [Proteobacteria bacterium]|nr:EAL domain-containing protein [Pseudomonadota bacterium]